MARVLTESPRPMLPQRHTIPPHVEAAVLTALEKLPADRFGSAAEFAEALAGRNYVPTVPTAAAAPPAAAAKARKARLRDPMTLGLVGVAVLATAAALWGWLRPGPEPTVNRFSLFLPPEQALQPVTQSGNRVAISPNGKRLVYVGPAERGGRLWLREHDQLHSTPIAGTEGAGTPFFSPDGRHIGFLIGGAKLRTVSLDGGPVLTLSDSANSTGGEWGVDEYIYFEVDSGIARMKSSGGPIELIYNAVERKEAGGEWPVLLPGARGIVFRTRRANQAPTEFQIVGMKLPRGEPKVIMRGVFARYSPSGHLLVASADGKIVAVPFDPEKLEVTGSPIGLLEGIGVEGSGFSINLGLSENGTLVYTTGGATGARQPVWVTREGVETAADPSWQPQGIISNFSLSPDGKEIAVELVQNGTSAIWVKRLPAGPFSRLTFGDTANLRPSWSADGRSVVYLAEASTNGGKPAARRADGTGSVRALLSTKMSFGQAIETRDGKWLVLRSSLLEAGSGDIYGVRLGDSTLVPLVTGPATEGDVAMSPDARWLAYASNESGTYEIYVRPFPETASARWQVSVAGGSDPVWSHTGRELFYLNGQNEMSRVEIAAGSGFSFGTPLTLFSSGPYTPIGPVPAFAISPDDKRFLFLRETTPTERNELIVVQNWVDEMKARARSTRLHARGGVNSLRVPTSKHAAATGERVASGASLADLRIRSRSHRRLKSLARHALPRLRPPAPGNERHQPPPAVQLTQPEVLQHRHAHQPQQIPPPPVPPERELLQQQRRQ